MRCVRVVGVDPGLASMGLAVVELKAGGPELLSLQVVRTKPPAKKLRLRQADHDAERVRLLVAALAEQITPDTLAICYEAPAGGRSARGAKALALCVGALVALAELHKLPLLSVSPQELKEKLTGSRSASKATMIEAITLRWPDAAWPLPASTWEHAADAAAAIVACLDSPIMLAAQRGL